MVSRADVPASSPRRILGLIPARGGSKRIPKKNIALLGGRPLIAYTIEAARGAALLTRTIVSTDDEEIRRLAQEAGAEAPFLRPAVLATDAATTVDVARHALEQMERLEGARYDYLCVLEPTAPFRTADDISAALQRMLDEDADSVMGLVATEFVNPSRLRVIRDGRVERAFPHAAASGTPQQLLEMVYAPGGGLYAARRELIMEQGTLHGGRELGCVLPRSRGLDIDTPEDWRFAEYLLTVQARVGTRA